MEEKQCKFNSLTNRDYNNLTVGEITEMKTGQYYCKECNRLFIGAHNWKTHINSDKHKKAIKKQKKIN